MTGQHVVMVVGNPVEPDNRVRKTAQSLAGDGYRVTLVGVGSGRRTREEYYGPVRVLHVPVPPTQKALVQPLVDRVAARPRFVLDPVRANGLMARLAARASVLDGDLAIAADARSSRRGAGAALAAERASLQVTRALLEVRRRAGDPDDPVGRVLAGMQRRLPSPPRLVRTTVDFAEVLDLEVMFGPVLDRLAADVVHAHDVHVLGVAARAVARGRTQGRPVRLVYDAHEYTPGLAHYSPRRVAAMTRHEARYIGRADVVTTVSAQIAEQMRLRHRLGVRPLVVHNAPSVRARDVPVQPGLRARLGIADDQHVVVYSGNVGNRRGDLLLVQALAHLPPDVHVLLITSAGGSSYLKAHANEVAGAGTGDRFHVLPYVPTDQIVSFLSGATVGFHGLAPGSANHEMALPNKLFEYMHAGLPVVVSRARTMAAFVAEHGIGQSFAPGDPRDLAQRIESVIAARARYAAQLQPGSPLLERYSWEREEATLLGAYRGLDLDGA